MYMVLLQVWFVDQSQSTAVFPQNISTKIKNKHIQGFPGGPVSKDPPWNAVGVGSIPGRGTSHLSSAGELSPCTTTTPQLLSPCSRASSCNY